jgi:penicillin-binding protein 1A
VLEGVPEEPLTPPPGGHGQYRPQHRSVGERRQQPREYFIEGTQPTQQAVHEVGTTMTDGGGKPTNCSDKKSACGRFFLLVCRPDVYRRP